MSSKFAIVLMLRNEAHSAYKILQLAMNFRSAYLGNFVLVTEMVYYRAGIN